MGFLGRLFESKEARERRLAEEAEREAVKDFAFTIQRGDFQKVYSILAAHPERVSLPVRDLFLPIHVAAQFDQVGVAEVLREFGADIEALDCDDSTPLLTAVWHGSIEMVKWLLQNGADPTSFAKGGITAISHLLTAAAYASAVMKASGLRSRDRIRLNAAQILWQLIAHGANVNQRSEGEPLPLDYAQRFKLSELADLLRSHGAIGESSQAEP